nr:hypothetical protein [Tanacetum cinerariifolium]
MEALAVYAQNGDQYHSRNRNFQHINCRTSQYGVGVRENTRESVNEFFCSELWAGPAYSTSPPPSSLPIPNFSIKPKRTVSLDLHTVSASDVDLLASLSKSEPTSPTSGGRKGSEMEFVNGSDDSATKTLRRILNLDMVGSD